MFFPFGLLVGFGWSGKVKSGCGSHDCKNHEEGRVLAVQDSSTGRRGRRLMRLTLYIRTATRLNIMYSRVYMAEEFAAVSGFPQI